MGLWLTGSDFDGKQPAIILSVGDEQSEPPEDVKEHL